MQNNSRIGRDFDSIYTNHTIYSSDLEFISENDNLIIRPVHDDILITKLRAGQTIELECICELGKGSTHAKWSPVSTA